MHKLEFLALKLAVVEKFQEYLYGLTIDIYTDNIPLMYMLMMAKLDAVMAGKPALQTTIFNCTIEQGR